MDDVNTPQKEEKEQAAQWGISPAGGKDETPPEKGDRAAG
jgi:hypothetical protein